MRLTPPRFARRTLLPVAAGLGAAGLGAALLAGCGHATPSSADRSGQPERSGASASSLQGTVTVLAAASLTESFDELKKAFEAAHPGVTVETSYGSSATLVQQVDNGAPASVLALAGTAAAEPLDRSMVKDTKTFATNVLEIAVPPGNPAHVESISDLARPDVKVVLCADTVPCGKAAQASFTTADVVPNVVSKEVDVKAALAKVKLGEVDAALVYRTDVKAAAADVDGVEFPESAKAINDYPIVALKNAANPSLAQEFVAYVRSEPAQKVLADAGFQKP